MHAPGVTDEIDRLTSASDTQLSDVQLAGMAAVYRKTSEEIWREDPKHTTGETATNYYDAGTDNCYS